MHLTSDWHLHSHNSCDQAALLMSDLLTEAAAQGIVDYGVTDHLHTPFQLPDLRASRAEFDATFTSPRVHFGVEASVVSQWELDEVATGKYDNPVYGLREGGPAWAEPALGLRAEDIAELGIEYVVGGTHWPLYVPIERDAIIRDYHRQNLFLATHPLVTIVAHPWWWMGAWQDEDGVYRTDPWLDDFGKIPASMHEEFAAAAREHGKVVEINLGATVLNKAYPERFSQQYAEYVAGLKAAGVTLSLASDCHSEHYDTDFAAGAEKLAAVGIRDEDLWRLPPREEVA